MYGANNHPSRAGVALLVGGLFAVAVMHLDDAAVVREDAPAEADGTALTRHMGQLRRPLKGSSSAWPLKGWGVQGISQGSLLTTGKGFHGHAWRIRYIEIPISLSFS